MAEAAWCDEVLKLANRYYDEGHAAENRAVTELSTEISNEWWIKADCYRQLYGDLCALISRVDPRPGAPEAPGRPW